MSIDSRAQRKRDARTSQAKRNPLSDFIWRKYMWLDGTLPLSMIEAWEKALLFFVFLGLSSLVWWSLFFHFPNHVQEVLAKSTYYIFGTLSNETSNGAISVMGNSIKGAADVLEHQRKRFSGEF